MNETPHFLLTHNRHNEAEKLLKYIANMNSREFPKDIMESLKKSEEEAPTERVRDIFKAPVLLKRTAGSLYLWFVAGLGFYGLSFNVGNLTGSVYINTILSGVADLPAFIIILFSSKLGRKVSIIASLFLGAVTLISAAFMSAYLNEAYGWVLVTVAMIGKFAVSTLFMFNYFWSSEVFPTTLRTTLCGVCSVSARIGSTLSPIIVDLYKHVITLFAEGLGPLIFGVTMLIGGFLAFYLPETNNEKIPETICEANIFMIKGREIDIIEEKMGSGPSMDSSSKKDLVESNL